MRQEYDYVSAFGPDLRDGLAGRLHLGREDVAFQQGWVHEAPGVGGGQADDRNLEFAVVDDRPGLDRIGRHPRADFDEIA